MLCLTKEVPDGREGEQAGMAITRIADMNVTNAVFEQLLSNITEGHWKPGEKLPSENELVEALGISRGSVRDAIKRLVGMGMLVVRRGAGTYVNEVTPSTYFDNLLPIMLVERPEYLDVQEYRLMVEPPSARIAAVTATEAEIQAMRDSVARQRELVGHPREFGREDANFHHLVAQCTRNSLIAKINGLIGDIMESVLQQAIVVAGYEGGPSYHQRILDCIARRDPEAAEAMMHEHISKNIEAFSK